MLVENGYAAHVGGPQKKEKEEKEQEEKSVRSRFAVHVESREEELKLVAAVARPGLWGSKADDCLELLAAVSGTRNATPGAMVPELDLGAVVEVPGGFDYSTTTASLEALVLLLASLCCCCCWDSRPALRIQLPAPPRPSHLSFGGGLDLAQRCPSCQCARAPPTNRRCGLGERICRCQQIGVFRR